METYFNCYLNINFLCLYAIEFKFIVSPAEATLADCMKLSWTLLQKLPHLQ